jgi:hypothetical protein
MKQGLEIVITVSDEQVSRIKLSDASKRIPLLPMFKNKKQILMCRSLLEDGKPDPSTYFYVTNWNVFHTQLKDSDSAYLVPDITIKLKVIAEDINKTDEELKNFVEQLKAKSQSYKARATLLHKQWNAYGEKMQKAFSAEELIQIMNVPVKQQHKCTHSLKDYVEEIVVNRQKRFKEKQKQREEECKAYCERLNAINKAEEF